LGAVLVAIKQNYYLFRYETGIRETNK